MSPVSCDRAAFAVSSRLLACLINESLLKPHFVPVGFDIVVGVCVVLSGEHATVPPYRSPHIFAIIPLKAHPILKLHAPANSPKEIALVDPLEMLPCIYQFCEDTHQTDVPPEILSSLPRSYYDFSQNIRLALSLDPLPLWKRFSTTLGIDASNREAIADELRSCVVWQTAPIEWEHAIVEGHPIHPMHRSRSTVPPMLPVLPGRYDFHRPRVRLVSFPRENLLIQGDFEKLLASLRAEAARSAGKPLHVSPTRFLVPVHELQIPNIVVHLPDAEVLPVEYSVSAAAQASVRTVRLPCVPHLALKLALALRISSTVRTISHYTAYAAPRFTADVLPHLAHDPAILKVDREVASVVHTHEDPALARHCAAVLRVPYDAAQSGERAIVAAALTELYDGTPLCVTALSLDSPSKRLEFLTRYVDLALGAFLPPLLENGVAFEAHAQNILARFDAESGQLLGFIVRDFGGVRVHVETLRASTGVTLDVIPGHCIAVKDVQETYGRLYDTLIHGHMHRLIRVLGFHHNGEGWACVRAGLERSVPRGCALWEAWLDPRRTTVRGKCLLSMKIRGECVFGEMPNLILFRPQGRRAGEDEGDIIAT